MNREDLQKEIINLSNTFNNVALQWPTGLGKSKAAIDIIYNMSLGGTKAPKILLVVAEIPHKENWSKEFTKWNCQFPMTVECYASLKNYKNTEWDIVIFDEAHHLASDLRLQIVETMKIQHVMLLSATLQDQLILYLASIFGPFGISKYTLKEVIDGGLLPEPKVFIIPMTLNNVYENYTIIKEWGDKPKRKVIKCRYNDRWQYIRDKVKYPHITLEISCTQQQKYNYLTEEFEYWKNKYMRSRQEYMKNKWLRVGSERKRFLGECKTEAARLLLYKLRTKRFICFCSSIEQTELLGGKNAIHSKNKDSLKIINSFNNKEINNLFAINMLQEGQNLIDIEAGVIIQLDNVERAFIQKFGRTLRADSPKQYIFYYKNTRDEDYLKNVYEEIDKDYIIIVNNLLDLNI